jgi:S-disulfanyl-L-cysteine oxidoreductase SoxD
MSMSDLRLVALVTCLLIPAAHATEPSYHPLGLGKPVAPSELTAYFSIPADGRGLPAGKGSAVEGEKVYADQCASCHGVKLEGNVQPGIGGDKLIGGRGSLATATPVKTTESYWPYTTTLFDYVKRAMPFTSPGSLTDDQVYAVVAYVLNQGNIIGKDTVLDAQSLPKVVMPNRDGFVPDPRPELSLYR